MEINRTPVDTDFAEMVKAELERRGFEVIIAPVLKNNGLKLTGITIKGDRAASPTLYLDSVPEEHRNAFMVPGIVDEMIEVFQKFKDAPVVGNIGDLLGNKPKLLKRIMPRLVNYDWNMEMLADLPHRRFLDLAVTYDIDLGNNASCRVRNKMKLSVSEDELYEAAMKNARERGYNITPMRELIGKILTDVIVIPTETSDTPNMAEMPNMWMLVVTNKEGRYGAYALLDEDVLKEIRERIGDFYILPSSIHELIIVPSSGAVSGSGLLGNDEDCVNHLKELVQAVNRGNVPREEWLSDSVYKYDGEIRMA